MGRSGENSECLRSRSREKSSSFSFSSPGKEVLEYVGLDVDSNECVSSGIRGEIKSNADTFLPTFDGLKRRVTNKTGK